MRHTQTPYALLHLQRVCSLSYLHLICISTLEFGINCLVANDVEYNYLALERQTLFKYQGFVYQRTLTRPELLCNVVMGTKQKMSCSGMMSCLLNCSELKLLLLRNRVAEWEPLQSGCDSISQHQLQLVFQCRQVTFHVAYPHLVLPEQYSVTTMFSCLSLAGGDFCSHFICSGPVCTTTLHWIRTAWLFCSSLP